LEKVVESAPNTPLFYYHIPSMTGVTFPIDQFLVQASKRLSTFRGIKFSDGNLSEYSYCVAYENGQYNILYGQDEQLLAALSMGGTSAVGSTYNYCGKLNNELLEAFASGDITTALEKQVCIIFSLMQNCRLNIVFKEEITTMCNGIKKVWSNWYI
jgi:N-acetylneuraminate lyase